MIKYFLLNLLRLKTWSVNPDYRTDLKKLSLIPVTPRPTRTKCYLEHLGPARTTFQLGPNGTISVVLNKPLTSQTTFQHAHSAGAQVAVTQSPLITNVWLCHAPANWMLGRYQIMLHKLVRWHKATWDSVNNCCPVDNEFHVFYVCCHWIRFDSTYSGTSVVLPPHQNY